MNNNRAVYVSSVIIIVIACLISAFSVFYVKNGNLSMSVGAKLRNTIEIPLSQADSLKVDYGSKNLEVYVWQEDKIEIKEYLVSDSYEALATVDFDGNRAIVTGGKWNWSLRNLFWGDGNQRIEIYLPASGVREFELVTGSGNIRTKGEFDIETQKADIRAGSGNITWENTRALENSFYAESGNIRIDRIEGDTSLHTGSGNITAKIVNGNVKIEAGSGNITLEELTGACAAEAGSGNIKVEAADVTGDITLKTGSGNQRLELPGNLSFSLEVNTGSGNIHTDYDDVLSYNKKGNTAVGQIGDNPVCRIASQAGSGNVTVKKK